jgi:hypothetical protein
VSGKTVAKPFSTRQMPTTGGCPFCGVGFTVDWGGGDTEEPNGAIYHEYPTCHAFETLTGDQFVRAVLDGKHRS